jgi:phosphate acyltransferase
VRIAVDAMGGDYAPDQIIAGAVMAQEKLGIEVVLVGDRQLIIDYIQHHYPRHDPLHKVAHSIEIVAAEGHIDMQEEPLEALRRKPNSSIALSMNLVKKKEAEAVVSAGHTGAAMAAALLRLGRLPGVDRPAIGALLPTVIPHKPVLLLDVGANVDCRPKFLEQFATMGSIYSRYALGAKEPKVGLLNIGEEACKGNDLALKVYQALEANSHIHFLGNAEGRDVMTGKFDVIVCDGFMGNVLLKFAEGVGLAAMQILKEELPRGWWGKIGSSILRPNLRRVKQRMDYSEYGGALLLGVAGVCVIGHGSAKAISVFHGIRVAKEAVQNQLLEHLRTEIDAVKALNLRLETSQSIQENPIAKI